MEWINENEDSKPRIIKTLNAVELFRVMNQIAEKHQDWLSQNQGSFAIKLNENMEEISNANHVLADTSAEAVRVLSGPGLRFVKQKSQLCPVYVAILLKYNKLAPILDVITEKFKVKRDVVGKDGWPSLAHGHKTSESTWVLVSGLINRFGRLTTEVCFKTLKTPDLLLHDGVLSTF